MIINHKYKFIFHKTRKVGGSSMELALSRFTTDDDVVTALAHRNEEGMRGGLGRRNKYGKKIKNHCRVPQLLNFLDNNHFENKDIFNTYFKFTILRDPVDNFISQYFFELRNTKLHPYPLSINEWIKDLKVNAKPNVIIDNWRVYSLNDVPIVDDYIYYSRDSGPGSRMYEDCERISNKLNLPENLADIFSNIRLKDFYRKRDKIFLNEESIEFIKEVSQKQLKYTNMEFNSDAFYTDKSII